MSTSLKKNAVFLASACALVGLFSQVAYAEGFAIVKDGAKEIKDVIAGDVRLAIEGLIAVAAGYGFWQTKTITPLLGGAAAIGIFEFIIGRLVN